MIAYNIILDGQTSQDKESFFLEVFNKMNFPEYFGFNWDSFEEIFAEVIADAQMPVSIFITNYENMLSADTNEKMTFIDILNSAKEEFPDLEVYIAEDFFD